MALHDDLLRLAREMVDRNPGAPIEAELRRAVSTAYYALFHLLVHEATMRLVAIPALRPRVSRSFDHNIMRKVCLEFGSLRRNSAGEYVTAAGQVVPGPIVDIAVAFELLQDARHEADYKTSDLLEYSGAESDVMRAELAFLDWSVVQADPGAEAFLAELFCRGIPKR